MHLRQYAHVGTGNYHSRTARIYTDYGLFTANKKICEDINRVFHQLTSMGQTKNLNKLLQSPFTLQDTLEIKIEREKQIAAQGKEGRIIVKLNSLVDSTMISALYQASSEGVKIDCIIRGMCSLRPGIPGISDNIKVTSIVGRFLEHDRVIYFKNDDKAEVFISSADWMERNLYHRVEIATPIENKALQDRIINELEYYLLDNTQAWKMDADGKYIQATPQDGKEAFIAQEKLLEDLAESS